jgi:hypothetical protein
METRCNPHWTSQTALVPLPRKKTLEQGGGLTSRGVFVA